MPQTNPLKMANPIQIDWLQRREERMDVRAFETAVRAAGGWVLARDLLRRAGLDDTEPARRHLRALAAAADTIISGQRGYCHLDHAAPQDIHHAAAWLESQARAMLRRAIRLQHHAHAALHRGGEPVQRHD
jgi:hypothetical protein